MKTIRIRNLMLGEGIPKICVPVMGRNQEEISDSAKEALARRPDIVEWRADFLEELQSEAAIEKILRLLRGLLGETPLLFTIRTKAEGGEQAVDAGQYIRCNLCAVNSGYADAVDVELFQGEETVGTLMEAAHRAGVKVIGSNHDFNGTPPCEEMVKRLRRMQELGMDAAKIAVMPNSEKDVLTLLAATQEMKERYDGVPVITMSMGGQGVLSRLCGEVFGSALTFGMAGKPSAPGQIPAESLRSILEAIHKYGKSR